MMPDSPRVSVIVPCFNQGQYLDEAVESVLAQTYQDFEILVVDDGSTDPDTARLLAEYERPKTRVFRTPNQGLARARNFLLERARGDYLCALDADDALEPTFLEKTVDVLDRHPGFTFVSCWLTMFGTESHLWCQDRCDLATLLAECTVLTAAPVRRRAVLDVGGYDEKMPHAGYEDWDLWITLTERGHEGTIVPEPLVRYRRHPGSMTAHTDGAMHMALVEYLIDKHRTSYARHWPDILIRKWGDLVDVLRANRDLEHHLDHDLVARLDQRHQELARLRSVLERPEEAVNRRRGAGEGRVHVDALALEPDATSRHVARLEEAVQNARAEVQALRTSRSWRITAPLRAAYGAMQRLVTRDPRHP